MFPHPWLDFPASWLNGSLRDVLREVNAGIVWRFLGIAQYSSKKAQLLGCSWANHLRLSSQAKGKGQSTHGVVSFSLMSPVLSTVCHRVTFS